MTRPPTPGVYRREADGALVPVHAYAGDDYGLDDVVTLLAIGTPREPGCVAFSRHDLRLLEITAHAHSFDHGEDFIRMCVDIAQQPLAPQAQHAVMVSLG